MLNLFDRLPADFSSEYLGKKFLKVPQAFTEEEMKRFPNIESIDEIFRDNKVIPDLIKVTKDGVASQDFLPRTADSLIDMDELKGLMESGSTVVLNKVHLWNTAAFEIVTSIQEFYGVRGLSIVFLTPPNNRGLDPHFDPEEVFILQTDGTKRWDLYPDFKNRVDYPTRKTGFQREFCDGSHGEAVELTLRPGDLLYMPRGTTHAPYCTDSYSCHITLAAEFCSWFDYISEAIHILEENNVEFRKPALTRPHSRRQDFGRLEDALQPVLKKIIDLDPSLVERRLFEKIASRNGVFSHAPLAEVLKPVSPGELAGQDFNLVLTDRAYFRVFEDHLGVWRLWTYHYECEVEPGIVEMLDVLRRQKSVSGKHLKEKLGEETAIDVALSCQKFGIAGIEFG